MYYANIQEVKNGKLSLPNLQFRKLSDQFKDDSCRSRIRFSGCELIFSIQTLSPANILEQSRSSSNGHRLNTGELFSLELVEKSMIALVRTKNLIRRRSSENFVFILKRSVELQKERRRNILPNICEAESRSCNKLSLNLLRISRIKHKIGRCACLWDFFLLFL